MKQNKTLFLVGGALLLVGAVYLLLRNKGKQDQDALDRLGIPPADDQAPATLPPATLPPATPAPVVLKIGDRVAMKFTTRAINTSFAGYYKGGSDGIGNIEKDKFAGIITGFKSGASGANYAILQGYAYAPQDADGKYVYSFMIPTAALTKI